MKSWLHRRSESPPIDDDVFHDDPSTGTDDLATIYSHVKASKPGLRVHSLSHDREFVTTPSSVRSETSSSASMVPNGTDSTSALIRVDNYKQRNGKELKNNYSKKHYHANKNDAESRKELNSLLGNTTTVLAGVYPNCLFKSLNKNKNREKKHKKISTISQQAILNDGNENGTAETIRADSIGEVKYKLQQQQQLYLLTSVLAALTISLGSCVVGFSTAYTSPALPSMRSAESTVKVTKVDESWIGSLMPLSALIGGMVGGPMIEVIGRKSTILTTAVPFLISFLTISFAPSVVVVMAGRSLSGFCVGICSLALPVYLGETVQPEVRGTLGLLPTTFGNVGMLLCFIAGKFVDWRILALLGAMTPIPFLICMFLIPETPQWYIGKGEAKKAKKSLQWLRGPDTDISQEFGEIEKSAQQHGMSEDSPGFKSLFNKIYIKPLFISLGLMFFQQMTGINAFMFYTVQIFQEAGSTVDHHLSTIIVGLVNFFSTFLATIFIDRLGRKVLLYISSVTVSLMLIILGVYFHLKRSGMDLTEYGWLPLLSFVTLVLGFSTGYGPIPWLMMGEILPVKIRGPAASVATGFNWACTFLITKTFVDLQGLIGLDGGLWLFAGITIVGLFFVIFCVPETQGKSLEDIERNLIGDGPKVPVRQVRRMSSIAYLKPLPMAV